MCLCTIWMEQLHAIKCTCNAWIKTRQGSRPNVATRVTQRQEQSMICSVLHTWHGSAQVTGSPCPPVCQHLAMPSTRVCYAWPLPCFTVIFSPAADMTDTSGHTTRLPVKVTRSPALTLSTLLERMITSKLRGRLPPGICGHITSWLVNNMQVWDLAVNWHICSATRVVQCCYCHPHTSRSSVKTLLQTANGVLHWSLVFWQVGLHHQTQHHGILNLNVSLDTACLCPVACQPSLLVLCMKTMTHLIHILLHLEPLPIHKHTLIPHQRPVTPEHKQSALCWYCLTHSPCIHPDLPLACTC